MTNTNIFEVAVRNKFRFNFKGNLTVEDLWDLKVTDLDSIFKQLNAQVKQVQEESLLSVKSALDKNLEIQIEIVKHIFDVKQAENQARLNKQNRIAEDRLIQEAIDRKKTEKIYDMPLEELQALLKKRQEEQNI